VLSCSQNFTFTKCFTCSPPNFSIEISSLHSSPKADIKIKTYLNIEPNEDLSSAALSHQSPLLFALFYSFVNPLPSPQLIGNKRAVPGNFWDKYISFSRNKHSVTTNPPPLVTRYSTVGTAIGQRTGRPRNRASISSRCRKYFLFSSVQTGSGAPPTSYPMGTI
jgi:hypothetical protein